MSAVRSTFFEGGLSYASTEVCGENRVGSIAVGVAAGYRGRGWKVAVPPSEWRKQASEFKLKLQWVIQADWYKLRQLDPWTLRKRCTTLSDIEIDDVHRELVG